MDWLVFAHIAGAMVWVGGGLMLSVIGMRTKGTGDLHSIREFAKTLSFVGLRVFTPAVLVILASGVWMVLAGSGDFTELWILLALAGFAVAFVIGAVYLSRTAIELDRVANQPDASSARLTSPEVNRSPAPGRTIPRSTSSVRSSTPMPARSAASVLE